jgi:hypothetical protein
LISLRDPTGHSLAFCRNPAKGKGLVAESSAKMTFALPTIFTFPFAFGPNPTD